VTQELDSWKERHERERRWFSLAEAADAVDEEDLADLIRSFNAAEFNSATRRQSLLSAAIEKSKVGPMFAWLQKMLPATGNFFELFEAHAESVCAASQALSRLFNEGNARADHIREINEREQDADNIIRETLGTVRRTFLTPFDRGSITSLISAMDDAIDEMQAAANAVDLYGFTDFEAEMRDMVGIIVDSARLLAEALPLLRDVGGNAGRLHELTERLVRMEGHSDEIHRAGLKAAFQRFGSDPAGTMQFTVRREIYKHLERIVDAFEDVANEIDSIVIDHA
jgi:predicted phosphate transport protein (TIGR00153 family)